MSGEPSSPQTQSITAVAPEETNTVTSLSAQDELLQALTPDEYPNSGGFIRARKLLARGIRLEVGVWYHLTMASSWPVMQLLAEYHAVPPPSSMASCLAYAMVHLIPADRLAGVKTLLAVIDSAEDEAAYAEQVAYHCREQEVADCVREQAHSTNADEREASRLLGEWLNHHPTDNRRPEPAVIPPLTDQKPHSCYIA